MDYEKYMKKIIKLSKKAEIEDEVPIAAIIVKDNMIISKAYNKKESIIDPTNHAEIIAIKKACKKINNWRLNGCLLFVNIEPCIMCFGAIVESRISTVVCGSINKKYHADILKMSKKYKVKMIYDVLGRECRQNLRSFFNNKR